MNIYKQAASLGLDQDQYSELLELFISTACRELSEIKEAVRQNRMDRAAQLAHSLKGAAINLGIKDLADSGKELENQIRRRCYSEIDPLVDKMINYAEKLSEFLPKRLT